MKADYVSLMCRTILMSKNILIEDKWHLPIMYFSFYHETLNTIEPSIVRDFNTLCKALEQFDSAEK